MSSTTSRRFWTRSVAAARRWRSPTAAARAQRARRSVGQRQVGDHRIRASERRIALQTLDHAAALGLAEIRPLVPALQDHVVDSERLTLPWAHEAQRQVVADGVIAKVAHREIV